MAESTGLASKSENMEANQPDSSTSVTVVKSPDDFSTPTEDPYNKAISYLERHNILQLFQNLTSDVIYHRPEDPLDYLIKEVQNMKQQRESEKTKGK